MSVSCANRVFAPSRLGFALLFAAATLMSLTPLARGLAQARLGARAEAFFICFASGYSSRSDALPGRPDTKHDRNSACAICAACSSGDAPLMAPSGFFGAAPVQIYSPLWTVADRAAPMPRRRLSHRPRAPPADVA